MFPLSLMPLPGEMVPLHIFEPRYRQLLTDAETLDIRFGIFCNYQQNPEKIGAIMKLESVIRRYPGGESDIIVKSEGIFTLDTFYKTYKDKLYPGGSIHIWETETPKPDQELSLLFQDFLRRRNIKAHFTEFDLFQMAAELSLDLQDRYKLLLLSDERKLQFVASQLKFHLHLLKQEEISRDFYHLN